MNKNQFRYETPLFITAIVLAVIVRFLNLGRAPLSDAEAAWAMQALEIAKPHGLSSQIVIGPQPAYVFLTALMFNIFGATNFMARFWPALAGSALALLPVLTRHRIGRLAAVIAAFGLALDPGLVAVARHAGSPMMALGFGLTALALWADRRPVQAGILGGVALLSGPGLFAGLVGLSLGALIARVALTRGKPLFPRPETIPPDEPGRSPWLKSLAAGALTVLILGTFFLRLPQGLAAWVDSLAVYLSGWVNPSGASWSSTLSALLIYQSIALLFACLGVIRWALRKFKPEASEPYFGLALCWFLASLILTLAYPSRQVADLVWPLVPLWMMAAWELCHYLPERLPRQLEDLPAWLHAGLILILAGLFYYTLVSTSGIQSSGVISPEMTRLVLLLGIFSLGALTSVLVALGWSPDASRLGAAWGILAAGAMYLTSALWSAAMLRPNDPVELWGALPGTGQVELMTDTLDTLSNWHTGLGGHLDIVSLVDAPSLRWALRDYPEARFVTTLMPSEQPSTIITTIDQDNPDWSAAYRGQDFVWWSWPGWGGALPDDFVDWIAFHEAPLQNGKIILWARSDLFPGGVLTVDQNDANLP